ncbi:MAG TPA: hypothetical protein VGC27_02855 [Rhizomicrobium sp.]
MTRLNAYRVWVFRAAAVVLAVLLAQPAEAADKFAASTAGGYARLLFTLEPAAQVKAQVTGEVLTISFDRKTDLTPTALAQALPQYIASARADPDGKTFRFALSQPVRVHTSASSGKIAVDLAPASYPGTPPDLPPPPPAPPKTLDLSKLTAIKVRSGAYQNFTRVVFDWPRNVPYTVFPGIGRLTVRFQAEAKMDFTPIQRQAPPWVKAAGWRIDHGTTFVELETDSDSGFHDFRDGSHIVVDVLAPKTDADAYRPPGDAKPSVTAMPKQAARKQTDAVSKAQAEAIASAAAKLKTSANEPARPATAPPAKLAPAANAPGNPATPAPAAAAPPPAETATPSSVAPDIQAADSKLIRNGAVLTFPGAGRRGAAVFVRGLTAWVVLQNAAPLDAAKLKSQLGDFPAAVDAASSDNVSILRITLKRPEKIAATAEGSALKVVIAPQTNANAMAIGFARNQDDPARSSLSTLLPGATKAVTLIDPVAGDVLTVIPGAAGRAMLNERSFVEFTALETASGIVLEAYVDDLSVAIDASRVTITRPGGLALTPPSMPAGSSPEALARVGDGPCFLDFARWKNATGGSFLATERRLRAAAARLKPEAANHARLALARFYLANGFAAEALGLVKLMQSADPALQSDKQLQTIRAAADYGMGRTRDAHNDIAGVQFDADRHAALWRGLIDAALENWESARANFERASTVLDRYQPGMQARVHIAHANAALATGRLEIADAELSRLSEPLERPLMLEANLARARLYAAEKRRRDADRLFAAVEQGGDERIAAKAVYYRVGAGLAAGSLSKDKAVNALERLRFRWRGDLLELNTLRKLASLYFAQQQWRNGLRTLRVAAQYFPNEDLSGKAQDDMRVVFVDLFLKGKADAMPPVEALAVFYDFIELTPIGPEGDEMIRRMADRLVAVDLLGPAADLLDYQVTKRLDGVARAQVATRLAMVQLMDHKPQAALETLRSTRISTLPDDINHQRLLMEARALAEQKQWDEALDLIGVDQSPDTVRLRADIYWQSGNWSAAAQKAEEALGTSWSDPAPLGDEQRQQVMRAAISYSLANDEPGLERLRERFAAKMKESRDANAFDVVTQRIDMHGLAFRDAAAKVASIDTLRAFMKDLQRRAE